MNKLYMPLIRECLKVMKTPTDRAIIDQLAKHIYVTNYSTMIVNTSRPHLNKDIMVKTLYVDVVTLSWTELNNMISALPNLEHVIVRVHNLIGGTSRLLDIIDNTNLLVFMVLVNGSYCNNIVNSGMFLRDWNSRIKTGSLHVYYQMSTYNQSVHSLIKSDELDKLLVMNCLDTDTYTDPDAPEKYDPIESLVSDIIDGIIADGKHEIF